LIDKIKALHFLKDRHDALQNKVWELLYQEKLILNQ